MKFIKKDNKVYRQIENEVKLVDLTSQKESLELEKQRRIANITEELDVQIKKIDDEIKAFKLV